MRVYELAKEYGLQSQVVLREIKNMGEFIRSASSGIPSPVERRLRKRFGPPPQEKSPTSEWAVAETRPCEQPEALRNVSVSHRQAISLALTARKPTRSARFEWYKGAPPVGMTKYVLDNRIVLRRHQDDLDHLDKPERYFVRELKEANTVVAHWASTLLYGWAWDDVLEWADTALSADEAVQIKRAGVTPRELGWHWEDGQRGDLQSRLVRGHLTVDEVILEVIARRVRD